MNLIYKCIKERLLANPFILAKESIHISNRGMQLGLSKQPNMILKNHLRSRIKNPLFTLMSLVSLAKAKVVIFHEPQNFFFNYFISWGEFSLRYNLLHLDWVFV